MTTDFKKQIQDYLNWEVSVIQKLDVNAINDFLNAVQEAYEAGNTIYIFGNGGSASTASHFVVDYNKGVSEFVDNKFNFICLNDNFATVTAIANDIGYEQVFEFQLRGRLKKGDLVIAISGSGNSPNIIRAVEYAKSQNIKVVGLTGFSGGKLAGLSDVSLNVPVDNMQITEDIHLIFNHLMMSIFYKEIARQ